ncbi:MAG: penicillin-binding transpeptidase domain-containing protein [Ignavibacteriales bacterium]|nr:penicillin-binding transpeptidase domain-containing protein [Ignavibacteriales bacterium]
MHRQRASSSATTPRGRARRARRRLHQRRGPRPGRRRAAPTSSELAGPRRAARRVIKRPPRAASSRTSATCASRSTGATSRCRSTARSSTSPTRRCERGGRRSTARRPAAAVVLDVQHRRGAGAGELARRYDPNAARASSPPTLLRNRALTDTFEPGSTMKPFVGRGWRSRPARCVPTRASRPRPGKPDHRRSHDRRRAPARHADASRRSLQKSSNVGTAKIALRCCRADAVGHCTRRSGFGADAAARASPARCAGRLRPRKSWRPIEQATIALRLRPVGHRCCSSRAPTPCSRATATWCRCTLIKPGSERRAPACSVLSARDRARRCASMLQMAGQPRAAPRRRRARCRLLGRRQDRHARTSCRQRPIRERQVPSPGSSASRRCRDPRIVVARDGRRAARGRVLRRRRRRPGVQPGGAGDAARAAASPPDVDAGDRPRRRCHAGRGDRPATPRPCSTLALAPPGRPPAGCFARASARPARSTAARCSRATPSSALAGRGASTAARFVDAAVRARRRRRASSRPTAGRPSSFAAGACPLAALPDLKVAAGDRRRRAGTATRASACTSVGVTGTNGKTSMLAVDRRRRCARSAARCGVIGTLGVGVAGRAVHWPAGAHHARPGHAAARRSGAAPTPAAAACAMEVSSIGLAEDRRRRR